MLYINTTNYDFIATALKGQQSEFPLNIFLHNTQQYIPEEVYTVGKEDSNEFDDNRNRRSASRVLY